MTPRLSRLFASVLPGFVLLSFALFLLSFVFLFAACGNQPEATPKKSQSASQQLPPPVEKEVAALAEFPEPAPSTGSIEIHPASGESPVKRVSSGPAKGGEGIAGIYSRFEKPSETHTVSTRRDTVITCGEGTTVRIKAGSFVSARTGKPITGDVQVEVKEYYRTSDILLGNLTTTSGGKLLETGGMVYIGATHNGEECRLQESSRIELGFPHEEERKEGMQLFAGSWGESGVEWSPMETVSVSLPVIMSPDWRNDTAWLVSNPKRRDASSRTSDTAYARAVDITSALREGWLEENDTVLMISRLTTRNLTSRTYDTAYAREFEAKTANTIRGNVKITEVSRYVMSTSRLGWINCDRFINRGPVIQFAVESGSAEKLDVKLVFHSLNSVMPGTPVVNGYVFRNVPEGYDVTVLAVKEVGGEYYVARKRTRTSQESVRDLAFEPVTIEGLKKVMEELNRS